jgi:hypothetical protein
MTVMKKIFPVLCFSMFLQTIAFTQGAFVNEQDAGIVAEKFFYERIQPHQAVIADHIKVINTFTVEQDRDILYYVFNMSTGGFVAVSAYDATPPVICYAFSGKYEPGNQPGNFKAWMEQYNRQIAYAINSKAAPSAETASLWKRYRETPMSALLPYSGKEILPLTTSTWDQGKYYNAMCPADPAGPGGHCVTGCVATTMGQLMNYFRWPETGTGSYTYDCPPYGTLSVNYDTANYRWDLMEKSLGNSNTEVSEILYHAGVSVDMVYGPDGSGMYNHKAAYSLKTYFKYSPETQYLFRDTTTMDWDSIIVAHLDQHIPMYYAGWSVPDTMGHAFICDGYQGEDYFHFNWGWSGAYDGYFYTDDLTPGGNYFNLAQELIINAVPDTNLYDYPVYCEGQHIFTALNGTIDDGSGPLYPYENETGCSWLITPSDSINGITLDFLKFGTDINDIVTVYDGADISAPVLGIFSGDDLPPAVTSTAGSMFIVFESDGEGTGDGFLASFESEVPVYCSGMTMLTAQAATLSDGSGSYDYHNGSACTWRILPEGASWVTLYFTEFETEAGFDLLKVYDLQTQQVIAEYSGSYSPGLPDPVTSPSGKMFLAFSTNSTNTAPGWDAYYESNLVNIAEQQEKDGLVIFPNPTDGFLNIRNKNYSESLVKINLADLSGRQAYSSEVDLPGGKQIRIDLRHLSSGIYILSAGSEMSPLEYHKIIIK